MVRWFVITATVMIHFAFAAAADFEIKCLVVNGDPKTGKANDRSAPTITTVSGQTGSISVGSVVKLGGKEQQVGTAVSIIATDDGNGAIKVVMVLEVHTIVGKGPNRFISTKREELKATVQSGQKVRVLVEGADPRNSDWVDAVISKAK